jgi:von Willebrand factor type A domain
MSGQNNNNVPSEFHNIDAQTAQSMLDRMDSMREFLMGLVGGSASTSDVDPQAPPQAPPPPPVVSTTSGITGSTTSGITGSTTSGITGSTTSGITGSTTSGITGSTGSTHSLSSTLERNIQVELAGGSAGVGSVAGADVTVPSPRVTFDTATVPDPTPPKSTDLTLTATPAFKSLPYDSEQNLQVLATIQAPEFQSDSRAPVDLVVVVDRSGSMQGEPLRLVKETLKFIVSQLSNCDHLAVVSYGSDVTTVLEFTRMDQDGKDLAERRIETIHHNGYTNLCGGLVRGVDLIRERPENERADVSSVLLLTDGLANENYKDATSIMRACVNPAFAQRQPTTKEADLDLPCTINTFGFSANHDPKMLKSIAEGGGGMFYFIQSADMIVSSFADCLGGLLSTTSQNLRLDIITNDGVAIQNVCTRFKVEEDAAGVHCVVHIPDMQSEERREILINLTLDSCGTAATFGALGMRLAYFNTIDDTDAVTACDLSIVRCEDGAQDTIPDLDVDRANNREVATTAMEEAVRMADQGDFEGARALLTSAAESIRASASEADDFCQALSRELDDISKQLVSRSAYNDGMQHTMTTTVTSHAYQRSGGTGGAAQAGYVTTSRQTTLDASSQTS